MNERNKARKLKAEKMQAQGFVCAKCDGSGTIGVRGNVCRECNGRGSFTLLHTMPAQPSKENA